MIKPNCVLCDVTMLPNSKWRKMSLEERKAAHQAGFGEHRARGLCTPCWLKCLQNDTLLDYPRETYALPDLIEEAEFLLDSGESAWDIARRLGLKYNSLAKAFARARARGLTNRYIPFSWKERIPA